MWKVIGQKSVFLGHPNIYIYIFYYYYNVSAKISSGFRVIAQKISFFTGETMVLSGKAIFCPLFGKI